MLTCFFVLLCISICSFFVGRVLPKSWFRDDRFPYVIYPFEKNGQIYTKIGIMYWKDYVPDMSKILPHLIPPKEAPTGISLSQVQLMIQETCIAEFVHAMLIPIGFSCMIFEPNKVGFICSLVYGVFNLPFIFIQRFNRPRFQRLAERLKRIQQKTDPQSADKTR